MSYKYNYLAFASDEEITKRESYSESWDLDDPFSLKKTSEDESEKKYYYTKDFVNRRNFFICSCGYSEDVNVVRQTVYEKGYYYQKCLPNKITCSSCKKTKSLEDETIKMYSKLFHNTFRYRYAFFEDDKFVQLVRFREFKGLNIKSKKLFTKEIKSKLIYNKITNRFYFYNSENKRLKITSLNINSNYRILQDFFSGLDFSNRACDNKVKNETKETDEKIPKLFRDKNKDFYVPVVSFLERLKLFVNEKDLKRLNKNLNNLKTKTINLEKNSNDFVENYCFNLSTVISIIQYPNLSGLLFLKGKEFYKTFLKSIVPYSYLKKKNPTSPRDIIKENIIQVFNYHSSYYKKELQKLRTIKLYDSEDRQNTEIENRKKELDSIKQHINLLRSKRIEKFLLTNNKVENYKFYDFYLNVSTMSFIDSSWLFKEANNDFEMLYNFFIDYGLHYETVGFYSNTSGFVHQNLIKSLIENSLSCETEYIKKFYKQYQKIRFDKRFNSSVYLDTLNFVIQRNYDLKEFLKIYSWNKIDEVHEDLYNLIQLEKIEKYNVGIKEFSEKYKIIDKIILNEIEFKLINNISLLENESKEMKHCVRTYAKGMSEHRHLIFSIKDLETGDRATLQFQNLYNEISNDINKDFWRFNQLKAKHNQKSTQKIIDTTIDFCEKVLKKNNIKYELKKDSYDLRLDNQKDFGPIDLGNVVFQDLPQINPVLDYEDELPF